MGEGTRRSGGARGVGRLRSAGMAIAIVAGLLIGTAPAASASPTPTAVSELQQVVAAAPAKTTVTIYRAKPNRTYMSSEKTEIKIGVKSADGQIPSGVVRIVAVGKTVAVQRLDATGNTIYQLPSNVPAGTRTYHAVYQPTSDWRFTGGESPKVTVNIHRAGVQVLASPSPRVVPYGQPGRVHVQVNGNGGFVPKGTVQLKLGKTVVSSGVLNAKGAVALATNRLATPGTQRYTVVYSGDANTNRTEVLRTVDVRKVTPKVTVSLSNRTPRTNNTVRADISVTDSSGVVSGSVLVKVGSTYYGPIRLSGGKASYTIPAGQTAGQKSVAVQYVESATYRKAWSAGQAINYTKPPVVAPAPNPCPVSADACVNLSNETAWLQDNGRITYGPVKMTAGRAGNRTRPGIHTVFWRHKDHYSSLFNNAPMPNSVFFDGDIAFHQGSLSVQSHGCIHLSWEASEVFFNSLAVGDRVAVFGTDPY